MAKCNQLTPVSLKGLTPNDVYKVTRVKVKVKVTGLTVSDGSDVSVGGLVWACHRVTSIPHSVTDLTYGVLSRCRTCSQAAGRLGPWCYVKDI